MQVRNMTGPSGKAVANQFIIVDGKLRREIFQSYDCVIAIRTYYFGNSCVYLDENYWDCSRTTGKYRNQFLDETKAETQAKIDSGEYKLVDLNK